MIYIRVCEVGCYFLLQLYEMTVEDLKQKGLNKGAASKLHKELEYERK